MKKMIKTVAGFCKHCEKESEFYTYHLSKCKECRKAYQRDRNHNNPKTKSSNKNKANKRRAMKNELPNDMTAAHLRAVNERFGNRCFLTGSTDMSIEHFVPLATGHGGHIVGNVLPMDKTLNISRKDKNFFQWFETIKPTPEMREAFKEGVAYLAELNGLSVDEFKEYVFYCDQFRRTEAQIKADPRSSVQIHKDVKRRLRP
ncbi:hypothetical protein [Peribacillus butanolivorans]|uniref:hypothetical protein n=1 Tax=Peribacillus butanolivorans TaxID=421767 RepID=UPI0036DE548E